MAVTGHNGGPALIAGSGWHRHCWRRAREALLPTLPIEVVRTRVRRAAELGLDYRTYASVRAQTGHDLVAFLFSSNALRATPAATPERSARLAGLRDVTRIGLAIRPLTAAALAAANPVLQAAHAAPPPFGAFAEQRQQMRAILGKTPADRVLLVAETDFEAEWAMAARLAACLPAARYFGAGA